MPVAVVSNAVIGVREAAKERKDRKERNSRKKAQKAQKEGASQESAGAGGRQNESLQSIIVPPRDLISLIYSELFVPSAPFAAIPVFSVLA